ncbi:MAG: pentapeptide repeat-containing protein [Agarilytica sp.]
MTQPKASDSGLCQYAGPQGERCKSPAEIGHHCYWHDSSHDKTEENVAARLEARAKTGKPMVGFSLRRANLRGINLVHHGEDGGYKLHHCDLYRADLSRAHLFNIDLHGSSLMKANLSSTNLNCANLEDTDLLGVNLEYSKLDNIKWSKCVLQEKLANRVKNDAKQRADYYEQAEEVYRNLRRTTERQGLFEKAGHFFKREMVMRRYQLPKLSVDRGLSKLVDLFCGYGEEPARVVLFSFAIIVAFAVVYSMLGITDGNTLYVASMDSSFREVYENFSQSLYFSIVTFTTVGYGDLTPVGITRLFAAIEAFVGSFTLALFVVVFVKKMTR